MAGGSQFRRLAAVAVGGSLSTPARQQKAIVPLLLLKLADGTASLDPLRTSRRLQKLLVLAQALVPSNLRASPVHPLHQLAASRAFARAE